MPTQQPDFEPYFRSRTIFALLCIAALVTVILLLSRSDLFEATENWTADWRTALGSPSRNGPHDRLAVVLVTEETLQDAAAPVPADRRILAKVIRSIVMAKPAAIGLDVVFLRPSILDAAADRDLMEALRFAKAANIPIILGAVDERARASQKQIDYHRDFLARAGGVAAHVFMDRKAAMFGLTDQVVRKMAPPSILGSHQPSFALALASVKRPDVRARNQRIAWLLPPADGGPTFLEIQAQDLIGLRSEIEPHLAALEKKIVLIGPNLPDLDQHLTPLSVLDGMREAGVRIHAQIVAQLLDDRWVGQLDGFAQVLLMLALGAAGYAVGSSPGLYGQHYRWIWSGSLVLVLASFAVLKYGGLLAPCVAVVAMWCGSVWIGRNIDALNAACDQMRGFIVSHAGWSPDALRHFATAAILRYWRAKL